MKLQNLVPVLDVHDVDASIEFYCGVLGFTLHDKVEWGGKTEWALLRCDQVQLMLSASQEVDNEEQINHQNGEGMFFLYHDNLESLCFILAHGGIQICLMCCHLLKEGESFIYAILMAMFCGSAISQPWLNQILLNQITN